MSSGSGDNSTSIPSSPPSSGTSEGDDATGDVARIWTIGGVVLCVSILIYLSYVARKAVNEELESGGEVDVDNDEETVAFLSPRGTSGDLEMGEPLHQVERMTETPFRSQQLPVTVISA